MKYFTIAKEIQIIDDFSMFLELDKFESSGYSGIPNKEELKVEAIMLLARQTIWEGDGTFYIMPDITNLDDGYPSIRLLIKQSTNGSTYFIC